MVVQGAISYVYDATGVKLRKKVEDTNGATITDYANGYTYENGTLKTFSHPEGYVRVPEPYNNTYRPNYFDYIYQYKDHLGNVRLSYEENIQLITSTSFDSSTGGFIAKGSTGATYSATLQNGELLVKAKEAWGGVRRTITNTAKAGDRYKIRVLADRGTTDVVRLFLAEGGDPTTPEWSTYGTHYLEPGVQLIEFLYTVTETGSLSIQLDKTDASALQGTETNFKLLEAKIEKIGLDVLEENNYYAFGMKHEGYNNVVTATDPALKYKYLGQERQDEFGLGWDIFRYRNYDYAIGRFFGVDPISEQFYSITNYQFAHNNPIWKIELEGLEGQETQGEDKINREPVKAFVVATKVETKVIQETTQQAASKSPSKLIGNLAKAAGTAFSLMTDYMSPNYGGETSENVIHGRGVSVKMTLYADKVQKAVDDWQYTAFAENSPQLESRDNEPEVIYRGGSFTDNNFTPRPGIDDGVGPKSGLSTFKDPLKAANGNNKVQALNATLLRAWGFQLTETPDGHVGIRPPSQELLEYWAASRGKDPKTDPAQLLTQMVKSARIEEIKI